MEKRSAAYGYFHLMEKGVRNCFDISFLEGSLGIGFAATEVQAAGYDTDDKAMRSDIPREKRL